MSNAAIIKRSVRKALETQLATAMAAASPPVKIAWPGLAFNADDQAEYVNINVAYGPSLPLEMGNTPRIVLSGDASIVVRTKLGTGTDRNDTIAGIVGAAYPYNSALVRDGVSVIIGTVDVVEGAPDGPWWMAPVKVNWTVWN